MTEQEAKTKWCPFSRVEVFDANGGASGGNRGGGITSCIGSACMAWRWDLDGFDLEFDDAGPLRIRKTKLAHGHCGLAGKS